SRGLVDRCSPSSPCSSSRRWQSARITEGLLAPTPTAMSKSAVFQTHVQIPATTKTAVSMRMTQSVAPTPLQRRTRSAESTTVMPRVSW
ncbi:unnamed protein product, partial [Ectocarpus sp. 4 AP-2014]